jgi:hypothetical protein
MGRGKKNLPLMKNVVDAIDAHLPGIPVYREF